MLAKSEVRVRQKRHLLALLTAIWALRRNQTQTLREHKIIEHRFALSPQMSHMAKNAFWSNDAFTKSLFSGNDLTNRFLFLESPQYKNIKIPFVSWMPSDYSIDAWNLSPIWQKKHSPFFYETIHKNNQVWPTFSPTYKWIQPGVKQTFWESRHAEDEASPSEQNWISSSSPTYYNDRDLERSPERVMPGSNSTGGGLAINNPFVGNLRMKNWKDNNQNFVGHNYTAINLPLTHSYNPSTE